MESFTSATVENVLKKAMTYAARPLTDFNKHEALEILESLYHASHDKKHEKEVYYRLVFQTVRGKMDLPKDQFRTLVLRLLGDKDHERVFDIVLKVDKQFKRGSRPSGTQGSSPYSRNGPGQSDGGRQPIRCYYCQKIGHVRAKCLARKADMAAAPSTKRSDDNTHAK